VVVVVRSISRFGTLSRVLRPSSFDFELGSSHDPGLHTVCASSLEEKERPQ